MQCNWLLSKRNKFLFATLQRRGDGRCNKRGISHGQPRLLPQSVTLSNLVQYCTVNADSSSKKKQEWSCLSCRCCAAVLLPKCKMKSKESSSPTISAMTPVQTSGVSMYQPNARKDQRRSRRDEVWWGCEVIRWKKRTLIGYGAVWLFVMAGQPNEGEWRGENEKGKKIQWSRYTAGLISRVRGRYKEHVVYQYNFKKNNRSMVGQSSEE